MFIKDLANKCVSEGKNYIARNREAFSTDIPHLHPAELMKRLERNMFVSLVVAALFTAFLVMCMILGGPHFVDYMALAGAVTSLVIAGYSFLKRSTIKQLVQNNNIDLHGLDPHYHFADIKKDLGILFLGKRVDILPIMLPIQEQTATNE